MYSREKSKYIDVQRYILEKIRTGQYKPGDRVPSENELRELFFVSRSTANKALSNLSDMGVVDRIKGKGTFVSHSQEVFSKYNRLNVSSSKISGEGHADIHVLLEVNTIPATEQIASKFKIKENDQVFEIVRLMKSNEKNIALDYSYFPKSFQNNHNIDPSIDKSYLHMYLRDKCDKKPAGLHTHINISYPNDLMCEHLDVKKDEPILVWQSSIFDDKGDTIGFTDTYASPNDFQPYMNFLI